ncbi:MAG: hypothetical protein HY922_12355 [Elusimicrobia bacterium]|nr:hypothetical protein [Elusimicrobiota bacterium]
MLRFILFFGFIAAASPAQAQTALPGFAAAPSTVAVSTSPDQGILLSQERGPWVVGEVLFAGCRALSEFALNTRVRARRGVLYTPSDVAVDLRELKSVPGVLSAKADIFAMPAQPVPENYSSISISTMMVRLLYTIEEKPLYMPGLQAPATAQAAAPPAELQVPPASVSGIVLTPTAYRGLGRNNRPGLGLDVNAAYFIGRLYGKNSLDDKTTRHTNYIDRIGQWFLSFDGKMQIHSEGEWHPAMATGVQGIFSFRDAPQPSNQNSFNVTIKPTEKTTKTMSGAYVVLSKKIGIARSSIGFMQGNAGNMTASLSEFLSSKYEKCDASGKCDQVEEDVHSKSTLFASLLMLPNPDYPLAVEFLKPNGMPLDPWMLNFKLGHFLKLNFDLSFLKFNGGWDLLGTFVFRYTQFPKRS